MKLNIDTTNREKIIVGIDGKRFEKELKERDSKTILLFIDEVLKKEGIDIGKASATSQVTEIEVNTGPGSFTGIRIGVAIANALGYALNIPVNGKKLELEIKY